MFNTHRFRHAAAAVIISMLFLSSSCFAEKLTVSFVDRAGYSYLEDGKAKGFMIDIAQKISVKSGIDFDFVSLPQPRAIRNLQDKVENFCLLGLFKNSERESFATFTKPIYKNQPMGVIVATEKAAQFSKFPTLAELLNSPDFTLGVVTGFSYGSVADNMIKNMAGKKEEVSVTPALLVSMLTKSRIDYMFADPEEYLALVAAANVDAGLVRLLSFKDIPDGNQRYLLCSKAVPTEIIDKLNAAIEP